MDAREIRRRVDASEWRIVPYRNAQRPLSTYDEIVSDSFENLKKIGRDATHYRYDLMYSPSLGDLRRSRTYTSLAPTYGMKYGEWQAPPDMRPYKPYKPKQSEFKLEMQKSSGNSRQLPANITTSSALPPIGPTHRRQYPVPASNTRFENFAIYWGGRARGLDYSQPFLHEPQRDVYEIMENRRYQRLYWSPKFIPSQPSPRHARQIMLTAY